MRRTNFDKGQHELAFAADAMFLDLSQDGGVTRFFETVKSTPKLADVPPLYPSLFSYSCSIFFCKHIVFDLNYIPRIPTQIREDDGVECRKKLYK